MKIISALVASVAAVSALAGAALHQHGGDIHQHLAALAKQLHLTPSQESQLKSLHQQLGKEMKAIEGDKSLDAKGKEAAMAKLHTSLMFKAKDILSKDQMNQLHTIMAGEMAQHMMQAMDKLGLNADQKKSVHGLVDETMKSMSTIMNDKSLTDAQKQSKAEALHIATMGKIHAILTPAQLEKAREIFHHLEHSIPPK